LRRQGYESVPLDCSGFCSSQVEAFKARFGHTNIAEYFNVPVRGCGIALEKTWVDAARLYPRETLPANADIDDWGVAHSRQPDCYHMTRMHHPLRGEDVTLDEIANHPLPRVAAGSVERLKQEVDDIHRRGLAAAAGMACTVWEIAWYIRSMEDLMADMMTGDPRAVLHLDRVTALAEQRIRLAAQAGVDMVMLGDDIGMQSTTMMSVELWREWLKPRLAAVIRAGREVRPDLLMFYHSCGYVLPFLDELIEVIHTLFRPWLHPGKYGPTTRSWNTNIEEL